jgi:hypothetical protein
MIETLLCTPAGQFALIGLFTNAIIGIAAYNLGRNNPSEAALIRERYRFFHFLLDHPFLFEMALETLRGEQNPEQNNPEHPTTNH